MKNGIDARAFAETIKAAPASERARLWSEYRTWIALGARAQGPFGVGGAFLIVLPLGLAAFIWPVPSLWHWAALATSLALGACSFRIGSKRERAWREANPFRW